VKSRERDGYAFFLFSFQEKRKAKGKYKKAEKNAEGNKKGAVKLLLF